MCESSKCICDKQGTPAAGLAAKLAVCLYFFYFLTVPIWLREPIVSFGEREKKNEYTTGMVADVTFQVLTKGVEQSVHQSERINRAG